MANSKIEIYKTGFCFSVKKEELDGYVSSKVVYPDNFWFIKINKRQRIDDEEVIDLQLICSPRIDRGEKIDWIFTADATISIHSDKCNQESYKKMLSKMEFTNKQLRKTLSAFIKYSELEEYDQNGLLLFDVILQVNPIRFVVEPIEQIRSTFQFTVGVVCNTSEYDWNEYSPKIIVRGTTFIVNLRKEKGKGHLQIYLQPKIDERNLIWTWNVKCTLKLLSSDENVQPIAKTFNKIFDTQIIGFGFPYFLPWVEFIDPTKKYVENGQAIFEIDLECDSPKSKICSIEKSSNPNSTIESTTLQCSICFLSIIGREPTTTKCGHLFCNGCIKRSIIIRTKCPMCNGAAVLTDLRRIFF